MVKSVIILTSKTLPVKKSVKSKLTLIDKILIQGRQSATFLEIFCEKGRCS